MRSERLKDGRINYNIKPDEKARLWEQIVEAARAIVRQGGAGIRFVPEDRESRHVMDDEPKEQ